MDNDGFSDFIMGVLPTGSRRGTENPVIPVRVWKHPPFLGELAESGLRQRFAKSPYGLKSVPEVRIFCSPPFLRRII